MTSEKTGVMNNLTLLSAAVRFLSIVEKLLPVFFSTWNDYLRQKNQNLKAEVDLLKTKEVIRKRIKTETIDLESLEFIEKYLDQNVKKDAENASQT